jgi:predicted metal-dependent phosphoesterase TrpH
MTSVAVSRADLHVHTCHSRVNGNVPFLHSRDCYSDPVEVYQRAKGRGMDIVTFTDHDSIDGCLEFMARRPDTTDFLMGEEVSCWFPNSSIEVHLGVYGITEAIHRELQPLRGDVFEAIAYLHTTRTFFSFNHPFHFFRHQVPLDKYLELMSIVPAVEVRNGTMLPRHNELVAQIWFDIRGTKAAVVAGSDAHTLRRIGRTWTEAPGRTAAQFLESLRAGRGRAYGAHGGAVAVAGDAYGVVARYAASVFGCGPRDHRGWHRLACAACVLVSPPAQFLPVAIAWKGKVGEGRIVAEIGRAMRSGGAPAPYAGRLT